VRRQERAQVLAGAGAFQRLLRRGLDHLRRESDAKRLGNLLVEHQLLHSDVLERDVARRLAAQDSRENFRRGFPGLVPPDADGDQRHALHELRIVGVTYAGLGGVGFGGVQNDSALASSLFRDVSINGGFANALLFGGFLGGDDEDDRFKITSLSATTAVPEPATMLLLVAGSGVLHRSDGARGRGTMAATS
jgi:hypothetical protein